MSKGYWKERNVLVTGANGFLGSWVSKRLVEEGANVVSFVRDAIPKSFFNLSGTVDKAVVAHGALEDYFSIERVFNEFEVDFSSILRPKRLSEPLSGFPFPPMNPIFGARGTFWRRRDGIAGFKD